MIKKSITTVFFFCISLNLFCQKSDSTALNDFKKFLPYILKGIGTESSKELDQETSGEFYKSWKVANLKSEEVSDLLAKIEENATFSVAKDYTGEWKMNFSSKLKDFETIQEIYKSNGRLSNVYIKVSDISILDANNDPIYISDSEKNIKYNEGNKLNFKSGQIHTTFPIKGEYPNAKGNIKITLNEYSKIQFKEFDKSQTDISFDLGQYKNIRLLRINKNRAYFVLPAIIDDIEITATNQDNEKFNSSSKSKLPKKIYDFGNKKDLTDEEINEFIKSLTFDDVFKSEQMLIYETNGDIENLFIYLKTNPKELASKVLNIKI